MEFDFTLPGLGKPESSRPKRVSEAIKNELSIVLLQRVSDPRLMEVTISHVVTTPDLKQSKVYYTVPVGSHIGPAKKAMMKAKGFFRSTVAKALNLRYTPELVFHYDDQNQEIERIDDLFRQIEKGRDDNDGA